jgi:hypothetical protein
MNTTNTPTKLNASSRQLMLAYDRMLDEFAAIAKDCRYDTTSNYELTASVFWRRLAALEEKYTELCCKAFFDACHSIDFTDPQENKGFDVHHFTISVDETHGCYRWTVLLLDYDGHDHWAVVPWPWHDFEGKAVEPFTGPVAELFDSRGLYVFVNRLASVYPANNVLYSVIDKLNDVFDAHDSNFQTWVNKHSASLTPDNAQALITTTTLGLHNLSNAMSMMQQTLDARLAAMRELEAEKARLEERVSSLLDVNRRWKDENLRITKESNKRKWALTCYESKEYQDLLRSAIRMGTFVANSHKASKPSWD